jgi:FkbM family methyltransferase
MMTRRGHHVFHYGDTQSTIECTENVSIPRRQHYDHTVTAAQFGPDDEFNSLVAQEIQKRRIVGDFLLCFWGMGHKSIADHFKNDPYIVVVEPSIGYKECFADFRVYTSYALLHSHITDINEQMPAYHAVIPCSIDTDDFEPRIKKDDYFLFIGRLNFDKGIDLAIQMTKITGKKLVVAGPGGQFRDWPSHVEYVGCADLKQRKKLMAGAKATLCLTLYMEPFGCVMAESLMSGTPVISFDWGAPSENIVHGVTGFRCRNMDHIAWAIQNIDAINPGDCYSWARSNYSFDKIASMYEEYFLSIIDVYVGQGFYHINKNRKQLSWLEKGFTPKKTSYENPTFIFETVKNDVPINFECESQNRDLRYFLSNYHDWEKETFQAFEKVTDKNKTAIDLGAWIGTTSLWLARQFNHVVSVECDPVSIERLRKNIQLNDIDNITVIPHPVSHSERLVTIGPREELSSGFNVNTGTAVNYVKDEKTTLFDSTTKTTTLKHVMKGFNDVCFIKCDIEGHEESIFEEVFAVGVPVHMSFHIPWWKDQNVHRFDSIFERFAYEGDISGFCEILFIPKLKTLEVFQTVYPKKRVGKDNDGGYIIVDIPCKYDVILSGGVADDISFETEFVNLYNVPCFAYDEQATVCSSSTVEILHKNIDSTNNLKDRFDMYSNVFIKMDIEGGEYEWIKSISENDMKKIKQMVIEFHSPIDWTCLYKISRTHQIVHFHGNNYSPIIEVCGISIPSVFECTYILRESESLNKEPIPGMFDQPNNKNKADICLYEYPFVSI